MHKLLTVGFDLLYFMLCSEAYPLCVAFLISHCSEAFVSYELFRVSVNLYRSQDDEH